MFAILLMCRSLQLIEFLSKEGVSEISSQCSRNREKSGFLKVLSFAASAHGVKIVAGKRA